MFYGLTSCVHCLVSYLMWGIHSLCTTAPWCGTSRRVAGHFEDAARLLQKSNLNALQFHAINCWNEGERVSIS